MIKYNKNSVEQLINNYSLYDLTGEFPDEILAYLSKEAVYYKDAAKNGIKIYEHEYYGYVDKSPFKIVKFNRLFMRNGYGEEKSLELWGERDFLPEEKLILEKNEKEVNDKREASEKLQYEALKKKFEDKDVKSTKKS